MERPTGRPDVNLNSIINNKEKADALKELLGNDSGSNEESTVSSQASNKKQQLKNASRNKSVPRQPTQKKGYAQMKEQCIKIQTKIIRLIKASEFPQIEKMF